MLRLVPLGFMAMVAMGGCRSAERAAAGGGSGKAPPAAGSTATAKEGHAVHSYELSMSADGSRPKVRVSMELPESWRDSVGPDGAPSFTAPGLAGQKFGLAAAAADGEDPAARIEQVFKWQYEDGAGVTRAPLPDGRLWASRVEGRITHARMFVPVAGGVVMGVAMLRDLTAAQLAEVRAAFETLREAR